MVKFIPANEIPATAEAVVWQHDLGEEITFEFKKSVLAAKRAYNKISGVHSYGWATIEKLDREGGKFLG